MDQILSNPFKHQASNYLETVVFRFEIFNKQIKQKKPKAFKLLHVLLSSRKVRMFVVLQKIAFSQTQVA